jgi:hypothetical protein
MEKFMILPYLRIALAVYLAAASPFLLAKDRSEQPNRIDKIYKTIKSIKPAWLTPTMLLGATATVSTLVAIGTIISMKKQDACFNKQSSFLTNEITQMKVTNARLGTELTEARDNLAARVVSLDAQTRSNKELESGMTKRIEDMNMNFKVAQQGYEERINSLNVEKMKSEQARCKVLSEKEVLEAQLRQEKEVLEAQLTQEKQTALAKQKEENTQRILELGKRCRKLIETQVDTMKRCENEIAAEHKAFIELQTKYSQAVSTIHELREEKASGTTTQLNSTTSSAAPVSGNLNENNSEQKDIAVSANSVFISVPPAPPAPPAGRKKRDLNNSKESSSQPSSEVKKNDVGSRPFSANDLESAKNGLKKQDCNKTNPSSEDSNQMFSAIAKAMLARRIKLQESVNYSNNILNSSEWEN